MTCLQILLAFRDISIYFVKSNSLYTFHPEILDKPQTTPLDLQTPSAQSNMAAPRESTLAFLEYLCLFFGISGALLLKFDQKQPKPYMDETFHIPQAQRYCEGKFTEVIDPCIINL